MAKDSIATPGASSTKAAQSRERFLKAANLLIRDQEEKYDECLVDRLFESVPTDDRPHSTKLKDRHDEALELISSWYKDESLINANHARLFKFQRHYYQIFLPHICRMDGDAENFWSRIPGVVERNNFKEISSTLRLLEVLVEDKYAFNWIIERRIDGPYTFSNIVGLVKYYLDTTKNYHIQDRAECLLRQLIRQSWQLRTPSHHGVVVSLKQYIEQSVESNSKSIYHVLFRSLNGRLSCRELLEKYELRSLFKRCFDRSIEREAKPDLNNLCKCLALACVSSKSIVEKLMAINDLGAIITYVTNLYDNIFYHTSLRYFIIYPIIVHCDSEDAQVLRSNLVLVRDKECFIERNVTDKHVTQCILYLRQSVTQRIYEITSPIATRNQRRYFIFYMEVILEYIKCNYRKRMAYKNVVECCKYLNDAQDILTQKTAIVWLFMLIDSIYELIESDDDNISGSDKVILLEMIRLLAASQRRTSIFRSGKFVEKIHRNRMKLVRWARKFTDLDILNEIALMFGRCEYNFKSSAEDTRVYVDLIWNHMYSLAKENAYHDLFGNVLSLSCPIDVYCEGEIMSSLSIDKHRSIPRLLGDVLSRASTDDSTIESILRSISYHYSEVTYYYYGDNYLMYILESLKMCSEELEHLIRGVCISLRRDLDPGVYMPMLRSLFSLTDEIIRFHGKTDPLRHLVNSQLLEIFHHIHESPMYPKDTRTAICRKIQNLRKASTLKSLEFFAPSSMHRIIKLIKEADPDNTARQRKAIGVVKLYQRKDHGFCKLSNIDRSSHSENILGLETYVDNVLNQELCPRGTMECY